MKFWSPGELVEIEHAADFQDTVAAKALKALKDDEDQTPYGVLMLRIRRSELVAAALREFCEIRRRARSAE